MEHAGRDELQRGTRKRLLTLTNSMALRPSCEANLIIDHVVKKFLSFYRIRMSIIVFTKCLWSMLWRIDPLLGKDLETNKEITAVAMQRSCKHAYTTMELLLETVFCIRSVQRGIRKTVEATQLVVS
jgi:hypothetical protein